MLTPPEVLAEPGSVPVVEAGLSTWGEGGFLKVWLNEKNVWVLRHQQELDSIVAQMAPNLRRLERSGAQMLGDLDKQVVLTLLSPLLDDLKGDYKDVPEVVDFLTRLGEDVVEEPEST